MGIEHKVGDCYLAKGYSDDVFELVEINDKENDNELTLVGKNTNKAFFIEESRIEKFYRKLS